MLTVIIPYIDRDAHLMERAVASVTAQTIPAVALPVYDRDRRGPQWARNEGLRQAATPFVTWLDADDTLEPGFADACLNAYQPNHYVYTDYFRGADVHRLPDHKVCGAGGLYGVVTRLIRAETARRVGGFDESLKRLEDTE
ncbi:glycosyltransferase family 2 protein, partial [bacterium]|nr:glycosyltransferase family 2 protein [bacterium]